MLVGTIATFLKFAKDTKIKQRFYSNMAFDDLDYMVSFGYKEDLDNFLFYFVQNLPNIAVLISTTYHAEDEKDNETEIEDIKKKFLN